jgi:hypothetical protein
MFKNRIWMLTLCLTTAGFLGPSLLAQDTHFKVYGGPAYVSPMSNSDVTFDSFHDTVEAEKRVGWNLGFEGRWGHLMGLEVDYVNATQDVKFGGTTIGDAEFSPLTATLNFHLIHTKIVDFYVGPSYSFVNWGRIHLNSDGGTLFDSSDLGTDSANGWGASAGLDIGLGKHIALTGGLKYLKVDLELKSGPSVNVDPLVARLGVAVRF